MAVVGVRKSRSPRVKYGEIPLSSGEIKYLSRKDEVERRRRRLLAVRDRERLVAQQVTQRYRANLRKLQQKKLQEAQTVNKERQDVLLSELHIKYQSSLQNMGSAHRNAREKLSELLELAQQEQQKWNYNERIVKLRNGKAAEELDEEQQASMARRKEIEVNMLQLKELSTKQRTLANERAQRELKIQLQIARKAEEELAWKQKNEPEEVITMKRPHRKDVMAYHFTRLHCLATPAVDPTMAGKPRVKIIRHNTNHPSAVNASEEAAKYRDVVDRRQEQNRVKMEMNLQQATDRGNNALDHDENTRDGERVMKWLSMLRNKERQDLMQLAIDESREEHLDEEAAEAEFARMFGIEKDFLETSTNAVEKSKFIDRVRVSWPESTDEKSGGTVIEKLTQIEEFESRRRQTNSHSQKQRHSLQTLPRDSDPLESSPNGLPKSTRQHRVTDQRRRPVTYLDLDGEQHNAMNHDGSFEFTQNMASGSHRISSLKTNMAEARRPSTTVDGANVSTGRSVTKNRRLENDDTQVTDRITNRHINFTESRHDDVSGLDLAALSGVRDGSFDEKLAFGSGSSSPVNIATRQLDSADKSEQDHVGAHSASFSSLTRSENEKLFSSSNDGDKHDAESGVIAKSTIASKENTSPNSVAQNDDYEPKSRRSVVEAYGRNDYLRTSSYVRTPSNEEHEQAGQIHTIDQKTSKPSTVLDDERSFESSQDESSFDQRNDYLRTSSNMTSTMNDEQKQADQSYTIDRRSPTVLNDEQNLESSQDKPSFDSLQRSTTKIATHSTTQGTEVATPTQMDEIGDHAKPNFVLSVVEQDENILDDHFLMQSRASEEKQYTASHHSASLDDVDDSFRDMMSLSSRSSVSRNVDDNRFKQPNPILTHSFLSSKRAQSLPSFGSEGEHALSEGGSIEHEQEIIDEELGELYAEKIRQKLLDSSDRRESSVYVPQYSLPHSDSMSSFEGSFYDRDEGSIVNDLIPMFPNGIPSRYNPGDAKHLLQEQLNTQQVDPSLSKMASSTNATSDVHVINNSDHEGTDAGEEDLSSASGVSSFGFSAQLKVIAGRSRILNFEGGMRSAGSSMSGSLIGFMIRGSEAEFGSNEQRQENDDEYDDKSVDQYSLASSSSSSVLSMEARFKYLVSMGAASDNTLPVRFNPPPASFGERDMSVPPAPIKWEHNGVDEGESIQEEWRGDHSTRSKWSELQNDQQNRPEDGEGFLGSPARNFVMSTPAPSISAVEYRTPTTQDADSQLPALPTKSFDMSVPPTPLNDVTDVVGLRTMAIQETINLLPPAPTTNFDMSVPPLSLNGDSDEHGSSSVTSGGPFSSSDSSLSSNRQELTDAQSVHVDVSSLPPRSFSSTNRSRPPAPLIDLRSSPSSASRSDGTRADNDRPRGLESEEEKDEDSASEVSSQEFPRPAGLVSSEILEPSYSRERGDIVIIPASEHASDQGNNELGSLEPSSRSTSLAEALRSRRPDFLRRMENRQEAIRNQRPLSTGNSEAGSVSDRVHTDRQIHARPAVSRMNTSSPAAPLESNPQQEHLLGRLASGERAKVSSKEMKDRTKRLYQQLPEVIERKRQEEILRRRRQRLDELREQEKVSALQTFHVALIFTPFPLHVGAKNANEAAARKTAWIRLASSAFDGCAWL